MALTNTMRDFWLYLLILAAMSVTPAQATELPPPTPGPVDFLRDVKPILDESCVQCHAGDQRKGGFSINNRDSLLFGGEHGRTVEPGHSATSKLIRLVASTDADEMMPPKGDRLTAGQIAILRAWIDGGVDWPDDFSYAEAKEAQLAPRRPQLPEAPDLTNPIDRLLAPYFEDRGIAPPQPVSDRLFARRVYLDLIGLLPTTGQLEAFDSDPRPDKRQRLVEALLDDHREYATHWLSFWNDMLRNGYAGPGFIDSGRVQMTGWLFRSLYENKPFDQFVRELLDPASSQGSEGFTKGIVWRGVVNASQRPEMQAAQSLSQVFFGVNIKCASCHDSPISEWRLADAYALAGVFADQPLEMHRCDKAIGKTSPVAFLWPQLGSIDPAAPRPARQQQLAALVTSPDNGRLTRTIVNRLWAQLLGRGLVEPVDEMDNKPWSADLLDFLAADLQDHGYDLKRTLGLICTSRAYQMPSVGAVEARERGYVFRGPHVRRMTAEQFLDALSRVTGQWQPATHAMMWIDGRGQGGQLRAVSAAMPQTQPKLTEVARAKWLWDHPGADRDANAGRVYLRRTFTLDTLPQQAVAIAAADQSFTLFLNGHRLAAGNTNWSNPQPFDLRPHLRAGENIIAVEVANPAPTGDQSPQPNPGGFIFYAAGTSGLDVQWELISDSSWVATRAAGRNWHKPEATEADWPAAVEVADADAAPWHVGSKLTPVFIDPALLGGTRAALAMADPLLISLGQPVRDQVVTRRDLAATTLQALELTNGQTLDTILKAGAERFATSRDRKRAGLDLIHKLYLSALGRNPTASEATIAQQMLGEPPTAEGVQDLLWTITMLPEFQLIY